MLKENVFSKMGILDNNEKELAKKVYDTQRLFHEHAQNTNNVIDKEFTRIQRVTTTFEEILNRALKEQDLNVRNFFLRKFLEHNPSLFFIDSKK